MTTRIINYFKTYAKYDNQQHYYYNDNLKSIFEHYYKFNDDNETIEYYDENDMKTSIYQFKKHCDKYYIYINLDNKRIIDTNYDNNSISDIIDKYWYLL